MTKRDPAVALHHMLDSAAEAVELLGDQTNQQVEGNRVPKDDPKRYLHIPWQEAISTRSLLVHGYDIVRTDILDSRSLLTLRLL